MALLIDDPDTLVDAVDVLVDGGEVVLPIAVWVGPQLSSGPEVSKKKRHRKHDVEALVAFLIGEDW